MNKRILLNQKKDKRQKRVRAKIFGTNQKPRLSVFRSNVSSYVQLIDDEAGKTLVSASTSELKKEKIAKQKQSELLGELIAKRAIEKGIKKAVFDRGSYKYHGRVKSIAESARKSGLEF